MNTLLKKLGTAAIIFAAVTSFAKDPKKPKKGKKVQPTQTAPAEEKKDEKAPEAPKAEEPKAEAKPEDGGGW